MFDNDLIIYTAGPDDHDHPGPDEDQPTTDPDVHW